MIGIVGSGGFVEYDEGVPMFNALVMGSIFKQTLTAKMMNPEAPIAIVTPDMYTIDSKVEGKQYIYGGQLNFTYQITDWFAAAVGLRVNYYDGYSRVNLKATTLPALGGQTLTDMKLDCTQRGWGVAPIISFDYHQDRFTVAARYEFRTKIETTNDTKELPEGLGDLAAPYADGAKTRYDMPATLEHGTNEFLAGIEWDINDKFTVSCGGQRTDYGLSDDYQQNTSFACDSYSVGLGGAWNITEKLRLNAGYFCTIYSDYTRKYTAEQGGYQGTGYPGQDVYSRTNHVIGLGIDYKF